MTLNEYDPMDELDQQIELAKARLKKQQQLNELNSLTQQVAAMNQPKQTPNDPMQRMLKFAFPAGLVLAGVGMALDILFAQFALGLLLVAFGAVMIGIKIAFTPGFRIPLIDKPQAAPPKQEQPIKPSLWLD